MNRARESTSQGDLAGATQAWRSVLRELPEDASRWAILDEFLRVMDHLPGSAGSAEELVALEERALGPLDDDSRVDLMRRLGRCRLLRGDREGARIPLEEAFRAAAGDRARKALALADLGWLELLDGHPDVARTRYADGLDMVPPPRPERFLLLARLGVLHARSGDTPAAESCFLGALEMARAAGDPWQEAACVGHLTLLLLQAGRVEECGKLHAAWTAHLAGEGADPAAAFRELGHGDPLHTVGSSTGAGPPASLAEKPLPAQVAAAESALLRQTLESAGWNQSRAARALGISEQSVRYKMRKHGIQRPA